MKQKGWVMGDGRGRSKRDRKIRGSFRRPGSSSILFSFLPQKRHRQILSPLKDTGTGLIWPSTGHSSVSGGVEGRAIGAGLKL